MEATWHRHRIAREQFATPSSALTSPCRRHAHAPHCCRKHEVSYPGQWGRYQETAPSTLSTASALALPLIFLSSPASIQKTPFADVICHRSDNRDSVSFTDVGAPPPTSISRRQRTAVPSAARRSLFRPSRRAITPLYSLVRYSLRTLLRTAHLT